MALSESQFYRIACSADASGVFSVLAEVAQDIPVCLDTLEKQGCIRELVATCCNGQTSWLSLDETGNVVGFLIGTECTYPAMHELEFLGFSGVELKYGGVLKPYRCRGRFEQLLVNAKGLRNNLRAVVKHSNTGGMAARLLKSGFIQQQQSLRPDEDTFDWSP